jgi:DNA-binding NtrC family response regulator
MTKQTFPSALLVEDDQALLQLERLILQRAGWRVLIATNAAAARALAATNEIDLLVSDVVLPDGNGWDLASDVLRDAPRTSVLLTSGYPFDQALARLPGDEHWRLLIKPFKGRQLLDAASKAYMTPLRSPELLHPTVAA